MPSVAHSPLVVSHQGWYVAVPILLSFVGMIMVAVGGFSCDVVTLVRSGTPDRSFGYQGTQVDHVSDGYVTVYYPKGCYKYSDTTIDFDAPLQAGKAFAILGTLFGVLTVIAAMLTTFVRFPPVAFVVMAASAFAMAGCGAIVCGVAFATERCTEDGATCKPGPQMYVVMVGMLFWIAAGTSFLFMKKFERAVAGSSAAPVEDTSVKDLEMNNGDDGEDRDITVVPTTVVETITNPDGTKTRTTTVTTFKDGQKLVEKTSETI